MRRASCCRSRDDCPSGVVSVAPRASPMVVPSAVASAPGPTSDILRRTSSEGGAGTKFQMGGVSRSTKRANLGGVNAILGRVEGRKCNSRPGERADSAENGRNAPVGHRGEPAATTEGCRGATLCKFTTYSAGRYDGIPRTCSRLRGKQARANELIAKGDGYTFIAAPRSPDLRHTEQTEETPLVLW